MSARGPPFPFPLAKGSVRRGLFRTAVHIGPTVVRFLVVNAFLRHFPQDNAGPPAPGGLRLPHQCSSSPTVMVTMRRGWPLSPLSTSSSSLLVTRLRRSSSSTSSNSQKVAIASLPGYSSSSSSTRSRSQTAMIATPRGSSPSSSSSSPLSSKLLGSFLEARSSSYLPASSAGCAGAKRKSHSRSCF